MPAILVVASCQPINQGRHKIDLGHRTIIRLWNPYFGSTCNAWKGPIVMLEAALAAKQWTSHSSSPNVVINFLLQLG